MIIGPQQHIENYIKDTEYHQHLGLNRSIFMGKLVDYGWWWLISSNEVAESSTANNSSAASISMPPNFDILPD
jgi:hypothetical protein